jgi:hypothetical protein
LSARPLPRLLPIEAWCIRTRGRFVAIGDRAAVARPAWSALVSSVVLKIGGSVLRDTGSYAAVARPL